MTDFEKARLRRLRSKERQGLLTESEARQLKFLINKQAKALLGPPEDKALPGPCEVK